MSPFSRSLAVARSHPIVLSLVAAALVIAALPLTNAGHFATPGADVLVDASQSAPAIVADMHLGNASVVVSPPGFQLRVSTAYELTIMNILRSSPNFTMVEIVNGSDAVRVAATPLVTGNDGPGGTLKNASFIIQSNALDATEVYGVREVGAGGTIVAHLFVGPALDISVSTTPQVVQYAENANHVMTVHTGVGGATVRGQHVPGGPTDAQGNYTFIAGIPPPGTYTVWGMVDHGADGVPERLGTATYTVAAEGADLVQHDLAAPATGVAGQEVVVQVNVTNQGSATGSGTVVLLVNNAQRDARAVTLAPGETSRLNFSFTPTLAGTYEVATGLGNSTLGPSFVAVSAPAAPTHFRIGHHGGGILAPLAAPIMVTNMTDFGAATLTLTVNTSAVTVVGVDDGTIPGANTTWSYNGGTGTLTILVTTSERPGASGDARFATVHLSAVGPAGSTSALDLEVVEHVTSEGADAPATATDGSFRAGLLGDADGDGDVDVDDAVAIAEAVVGARPMSSIAVADADVSGDGVVTGRDAMMVRQHLAGTRPSL